MKIKKPLRSMLFALSCGALVSMAIACGGSEAEDTPVVENTPTATSASATAEPTSSATVEAPEGVKRGGELIVANAARPAHYDLQQSTTENNLSLQGALYNNLLMYSFDDHAKSIEEDLAESWSVSDDGLSYTFKLRPDVKFHDGAVLTADDVVATFDRIVNPPEGVLSVRQPLFSSVTNIEAVDPLTVKFTLSEPNVIFVNAVAIGWNAIYRKETLDANGGNLRAVLDAPGTGPFKMGEHQVGEWWNLDRFEGYWNDPYPFVDRVKMINMPATTRAAALLSGQVDVARAVPPPDYQAIQRTRPEILTSFFAYMNNTELVFNTAKEPWNDSRIRRAIFLVVDKPGVNYSDEVSTCGYVGEWMPQECLGGVWSRSEDELRKTPGWRSPTDEDIAEAKALMAEAGYPDGITGVDVLARGALQADNFVPWQDSLRRHLGIETTITLSDGATYFEVVAGGDWDWTLGTWINTLDDPSEIWPKAFLPDGAQNYGKYSNQEVTDLLMDIQKETDSFTRSNLVYDMQLLLDQEVPVIPFKWMGQRDAWQPYVKGLPADVVTVGNYSQPQFRRWERAWLDK